MITTEEAEQIILEQTSLMPSRLLAIEDIAEEVLREDLIADTPLPSYDRVMMDGVAVALDPQVGNQKTFTIKGTQRAGAPVLNLIDSNSCLEVMTGASLPLGANCVIPYEELTIENGMASYHGNKPLKPLTHIHTKGRDAPAGTVLVRAGTNLLAAEWGIAASIGKTTIAVSQRPSIALVSTGDELVEVHEQPLPYQARRSNVYALSAAIRGEGFQEMEQFHFPDDKEVLACGVKKLIAHFNYVIFSGAVSKGRFDYLPEVLAEAGIQPLLHGVAQRPGKPMWFGKGTGQQMIFGLPGNPVSSLVCMHRYVIPSLRKCLGLTPTKLFAVLTEDVTFVPPLTYFLPVKVDAAADGRLYAKPCKMNCSGDFFSLSTTDGFVELPAARSEFPRNEVFPLWLWHRPRFIDK